MEQNTSKVLKWSVIIGIVIVLNLFFNYALSVIYKAPDFNNICKEALAVDPITTSQACINVGGKWSADVTAENKNFNCDATFTCGKTYQTEQDKYNRNVFISLVVLGVLTLVVSFFFMSNMVIASGLAIGSVLSFIIASVRYWGSANDIIKLIILGVALVVLLGLAAKKFSSKKSTPTDYDRPI